MNMKTMPPMPEMRSRLAPTPSGFLHIGNALSFVLTWLVVRKHHGSLHLRIDDLDAERTRPEYLHDIFDTLDWLELDYDTGPRTVREFEQHWSQRHRLAEYHAAIESLKAASHLSSPPLLFACECSRTSLHSLIASNPALSLAPSRYPDVCTHKHISLDTPNTALRVAVERDESVAVSDILQGRTREPVGATLGSFVVRRKDGIPAYHLASLVDDVREGVTFVVRGQDLWPSSAAQLLLAERLGLEAFQKVLFLHHPLLTDETGRKLSKSAGAASLKAMRDAGVKPSVVMQRVARALGLDERASSNVRELLAQFRLESLQYLAPRR